MESIFISASNTTDFKTALDAFLDGKTFTQFHMTSISSLGASITVLICYEE